MMNFFVDRVKVINGICSTTISEESESLHLFNVLNWSSFGHVSKNKSTKIDNETINTVQLSIELQKKMFE